MKLFHAKCHERVTLRKLWRQTGTSSLLPAKCWPLLHVIRSGLMLLLESQRVFQNLLLFCYITNHFMTGPLGNSEFCFPRLRLGNIEILGKQNSLFPSVPRDQSLSVKCLLRSLAACAKLCDITFHIYVTHVYCMWEKLCDFLYTDCNMSTHQCAEINVCVSMWDFITRVISARVQMYDENSVRFQLYVKLTRTF